MLTTHGKMKHELFNLLDIYKKFFINKVEDTLFKSIYDKFCLYILHYDEQYFLEDFVKEYFKMRGLIVDNRNAMIDGIQSDLFKKETIINKIITRKELKYWQSLCESINKFEKEFYARTNISLLRVENERWAREQKKQTL